MILYNINYKYLKIRKVIHPGADVLFFIELIKFYPKWIKRESILFYKNTLLRIYIFNLRSIII